MVRYYFYIITLFLILALSLGQSNDVPETKLSEKNEVKIFNQLYQLKLKKYPPPIHPHKKKTQPYSSMK